MERMAADAYEMWRALQQVQIAARAAMAAGASLTQIQAMTLDGFNDRQLVEIPDHVLPPEVLAHRQRMRLVDAEVDPDAAALSEALAALG